MSDTITLSLNALCGTLIFFGVFWGFIRGIKKTTSRLLFLILTSVILLFVMTPIMKALLNIPFNISFQMNDTLIEGSMSISEVISAVVKNLLGEGFTNNNPEFTELIIALPIILVNSIVYVILFWILKLILLPINALITRLVFPKRKRKVEEMGFASLGEGPEYPNSDKSIDPLMEIYKNSENTTTTQTETSQVGVFIKKDNQIGQNIPSGQAVKPIANETEKSNESKFDIKKQQKADKKAKKLEKKLSKPKKYRLWGALVGVLVGLVTTFNTMIPVYGIMDIVKTNNETEFKNLSDTPLSLEKITNGLTNDIIKGYELSVVGRLSTALGIEQIGLNGFDKLTTAKIGDKKIVLREDVTALVNTAKQADNLIGLYKNATINGLENISQEDLTALLLGTENLIDACEKTGLVKIANQYILPIAYELMLSKDIKISNNEQINDIILDTLETLANTSNMDIFSELKSIVNLAKYLDEQKLLIRIVSNNYEDILTSIKNLDDDFNDKLTEKLFAIKTIDVSLPNVINIGMSVFDDMVNFGYVENTATREEVKTSFLSLINNLVNTAKTLSEDSSIYVTDDTLVPLGATLDTLRNSKLFNIDTYNNLLSYAIEQIKTKTSTIIPENFTEVFNNQLLRNIEDVISWENEMSVIKDTLTILRDKEYGILGTVTEGQELRQGYEFGLTFEENTFINIGKALDTLEESILLGSKASTSTSYNYKNTTITNLVACLITELKARMVGEDPTINDILSISNIMQEKLYSAEHEVTSDSHFWENEMTAISPLIIYISDIADSGEIDLTSDLGKNLDKCAHGSVLFKDEVTLKLMAIVLDYARETILGENFVPSNEQNVNNTVYKLLTAVINNLNNNSALVTTLKNTNNFWEHEIGCFIDVKDIVSNNNDTEDKTTLLSNMGPTLDNLYTSQIIPDSSLDETIASIIREIKMYEDSEIKRQINIMLEETAIDISSPSFYDGKTRANFWEKESKHLETLLNIKFEDDPETNYKILDHLSEVGAEIDKVVFGTDNLRASYLFTADKLRRVLSASINEMSSSILSSFEEGEIRTAVASAITKISKNIYNEDDSDAQADIESFEFEFAHLTTLANLEIDSGYFQYTTFIEQLKTNLQNLGAQLDSIAHNITDETIKKYNDTLNSKIITREILGEIIASAFSSAKVETPANTLESAFNDLIVDIQTSITTIIEENRVITWARELSYVSKLIELNNPDNTEVDLTNITTLVTPYLDAIAFNFNNNAYADIKYVEEKDAQQNIIGYNIDGTYDLTYTENNVTKELNSVIISRDMIKDLVEAVLVDFKETGTPLTDVQTITNELIDNVTLKINTSKNLDGELYSTFTQTFDELNCVKTNLTDLADKFDGKELDTITQADMVEVDSMLSDFQNKNISHVLTTRKIAILLLDKVENILTQNGTNNTFVNGTELGARLSTLQEHYNENIDSQTEEVYSATESSNIYANPFVSLYNLLTQYQTPSV